MHVVRVAANRSIDMLFSNQLPECYLREIRRGYIHLLHPIILKKHIHTHYLAFQLNGHAQPIKDN